MKNIEAQVQGGDILPLVLSRERHNTEISISKEGRMEIGIVKEDERCVLHLAGRFDGKCQREFLEAVAQVVADGAPEIQFDLASAEYLDSSALGMLLLAREKARGAGKTVSIANARGAVRQVLNIANYNKLFGMT